jgi:hypothetical protein
MSDHAREVAKEELFLRRLKEHFDAPTPEPTKPEVAAIVRRARNGGAQPVLRVVGENESLPALPENSRRRWWWAAIPTAALAAAFALWVSSDPEQPSAVTRAGETPNANIDSTGKEITAARSELVLSAGDVRVDGAAIDLEQSPLEQGQSVATGDGRACLTVDPSVAVCLEEDSEVVLESLARDDLSLEVVRGSAVAQLEKLPSDHVFVMTAAGVRAQAVGTVFQVAHQPEKKAVVTVLSGTVSVGLGVQTSLKLPQHTRVDVDLRTAAVGDPKTVSRIEETVVWSQLAHAKWWKPTEVGVVEVLPPDDGKAFHSASIDGEPALPLPVRVLLPLGEHEVVALDGDGKELGRTKVVSNPSTVARLDLDDTARSPSSVAKQPQSAGALLRLAREQRSAGQSAAALATYARLRRTHAGSPEANTVLVPMGKLQLRVGQASKALDSFNRYLQSGGPLAPEALGGKIEALRALGRHSSERAAIETYLSRYPQGFAAPRLRARLGELAK